MKKFLAGLLFLCFALPLIAQTGQGNDTIVRLGGRRLAVDVLSVSGADVTYKDLKTGQTKSLERKQIEKVIYKSGRIEVFNKPVLQMIDENQWEAILVTEKEGDVEGMYDYGIVSAKSSSDATSNKSAKKSATIRLQKKAANLGANVVLITKAEAKGGYGEIPGYEMEGKAYGFKPPQIKEDNGKGDPGKAGNAPKK